MASLQGLPPLPKSLSGLLNFSSAQWKEMERLHAMRTMIQQDLSRGIAERSSLMNSQGKSDPSENSLNEQGSPSSEIKTKHRANQLDVQLALLRKEMVGLRQLDMFLLCQLWSLNESIQEYKQLLQDRMSSLSLSPIPASSPGWDNGLDSPSSEEHGEINCKSLELDGPDNEEAKLSAEQGNMNSLPAKLSSAESDSHSSLEYGDI